MSVVEILLAAMVLDALIGDPDTIWRRISHPAALIGGAIGVLDRHLNQRPAQKLKGACALLGLVALAAIAGIGIARLPDAGVVELMLVAVLLAQNSLVKHVGNVARALETGLPEAQKSVALIVGRDPAGLDHNGVARAAIESLAENFSDGVVAPVFWYLLLGLPGLLIYKTVNTADSMIGHRTERYAEFGWAAARVDDVMNWLPARFSGVLIWLASMQPHAFRTMWNDAGMHRSPNAGWPEAAMAGALGVAISGPRVYGGAATDDPFVNASGRRDLEPADIDRAVRLTWQSWVGLFGIVTLIWWIF